VERSGINSSRPIRYIVSYITNLDAAGKGAARTMRFSSYAPRARGRTQTRERRRGTQVLRKNPAMFMSPNDGALSACDHRTPAPVRSATLARRACLSDNVRARHGAGCAKPATALALPRGPIEIGAGRAWRGAKHPFIGGIGDHPTVCAFSIARRRTAANSEFDHLGWSSGAADSRQSDDPSSNPEHLCTAGDILRSHQLCRYSAVPTPSRLCAWSPAPRHGNPRHPIR
jgi:hypothetical protein